MTPMTDPPQEDETVQVVSLSFLAKDVTDKSDMVGLVGQKCTINCFLNGKKRQLLWDTGAQVSLVSKRWLDRHLHGVKVRDLSEWGTMGTSLKVTSANGSAIPLHGWCPLRVGVGPSVAVVPFVVTNVCDMQMPILGFNAIHTLFGEGPVGGVHYAFPHVSRQVAVTLETRPRMKTLI